MTYAAIDIGTLKVKFLIAKIDDNHKLTPIYQSNQLTCLGCDMNRNGGYVSRKNLNDTVNELRRCRELLNKYSVSKFRVVSTHAIRKAQNREYVLKIIKKRTGFDVENISQNQEAELFFNVVLRDFSTNKRYAVVDMGGGSVQLLIGNRRKLEQKYLFPTGAGTLHNKFTKNPADENSHTTENELDQMRKYILTELLPIEENLRTPIIYGSSNVIDLMKTIDIPLEHHSDSESHPYLTYAKYLEAFIQKVLPLNYAERENKYPFQYGYMWGIDKSFTNISTISKYVNSPYIVPSNANISQGIIYSMVE